MIKQFARTGGKTIYTFERLASEFLKSDKQYIELINRDVHYCRDSRCFYILFIGNSFELTKMKFIKFAKHYGISVI